jgi:hypothetical protein
MTALVGIVALHPAKYAPLFSTICIGASALWLGTLFSVSWLCSRATLMADGPEIGRLSVSLFRRWTIPSLFVSVSTGALWCEAAADESGQTHWLYGVVLAGLALVSLSATVGRRAARLVRGSREAAKGEWMRRLALVVSVWAAIALATFRSSLVP